MIVVLIGYMASGKSTIGKKLATKVGFDFLDLDDYIVEKEQQTILDIFQNKGEIYFRKSETEYLKHLLHSKDNIILSLGGGTPCYGNNMALIKNSINVKSIYLKASIGKLSKNLFKNRAKRPMVAHLESKQAMAEFVGKHLFERLQFYIQADYTIDTDGRSKKKIVNKIRKKLF